MPGPATNPPVQPLPFEPAPRFVAGPMANEAEMAKCQGKKIGVLIVAYNAVTTLTKVLKRITPTVWENVEEVAVFDDASQDATFELAVGLKAIRDLPKLQVLHHARNLGYGGNQKAGYRYFIDKGFDIVVLLHGDGQYAPEMLAHLYSPIVNGEAQAVFGSRMMPTYGGPLKGGMPLYKYVGNRILTMFENRALGMKLTEFHSGYRAYDLHALSRIGLSRMTDEFHFDTEIIIKLQHQKFTIREVPVPTYYGTEISYVNGLRYAKDVARAVYRYKQSCRSVRSYPEFAEYYTPYSLKRSRGSSHQRVQRMVGTHQDVLAVGSGSALVAEALTKSGNRVESEDLPAPDSRRFDRVLLLDVLEHLQDPERMLAQCRGALKDDGHLIVSVPNIANITVRLSLLAGRFDYAERGILDRTHLRFFTRRTARRLLTAAGYEVLEQRMTVMPVELVLGLSPENRVMRAINFLLRALTRLMPGLLGYQIMLVARPVRRQG